MLKQTIPKIRNRKVNDKENKTAILYTIAHKYRSKHRSCVIEKSTGFCGHIYLVRFYRRLPIRSAARVDLAVPRSRTTRYSQRCFAVSGPTLWNSLPLSVGDPSLTLTQFRAFLKTVLFCEHTKH